MTNENKKLLSKEDSKALLQKLIKEGCLKQVELVQYGVRLCTILECWDDIAYEKYKDRLTREDKALATVTMHNMKHMINEQARQAIDQAIEKRNKALA